MITQKSWRLTNEQVAKVAGELPGAVRGLIAQSPGELYLAGGFIASVLTGETPRDVDLFCAQSARSRILKRMHDDGWALQSITKKSHTFVVDGQGREESVDVQLITSRDFREPEDVLKFDFVHCEAAIWMGGDDGTDPESYCTGAVYRDAIATKELIPDNLSNPIHTADRMRKFLERGWTITPGNLSFILAAVAKEVNAKGLDGGDLYNLLTGAES